MALISKRIWIAACAGMTACTNGTSADPPAHSVPREHQSTSAGTTPRRDALQDALRERILADAAKRTGVRQSELEVVSTEKITWDDGSLGCPQPDRMYTQALVPGYRVRVRSREAILEYHAAESGIFVLCSLPDTPLDHRDAR